MAHYIGRVLHIRPNDILDGWCVPELIVAYGEYANEQADKHFREWLASKKAGGKVGESPPRKIVTFVGVDKWENEDG